MWADRHFKVRSSLSRFSKRLKTLKIKYLLSIFSLRYFRPKWVLKKALRYSAVPCSRSIPSLPQRLQRVGTSKGEKQSLRGRQCLVQPQAGQHILKGCGRTGMGHSFIKLTCCSCMTVLRQCVSFDSKHIDFVFWLKVFAGLTDSQSQVWLDRTAMGLHWVL